MRYDETSVDTIRDQDLISRSRSRYVVETANTIISQPAPTRSKVKDDRIVFLGTDQTGVLLEVVAVEADAGLLIIHAMRMRDRYRTYMK
jgi:hypothetical protein